MKRGKSTDKAAAVNRHARPDRAATPSTSDVAPSTNVERVQSVARNVSVEAGPDTSTWETEDFASPRRGESIEAAVPQYTETLTVPVHGSDVERP